MRLKDELQSRGMSTGVHTHICAIQYYAVPDELFVCGLPRLSIKTVSKHTVSPGTTKDTPCHVPFRIMISSLPGLCASLSRASAHLLAISMAAF